MGTREMPHRFDSQQKSSAASFLLSVSLPRGPGKCKREWPWVCRRKVAARTLVEEALGLSREVNSTWGIAYALEILAAVNVPGILM